MLKMVNVYAGLNTPVVNLMVPIHQLQLHLMRLQIRINSQLIKMKVLVHRMNHNRLALIVYPINGAM